MSADNLKAIDVQRLNGTESFCLNSHPKDINLLSFWQWSSSDIVGNALRGVLAEYIVSCAVGENGGVRREWDAYDVETHTGLTIEVKSAAYIQSWDQNKLSNIQFSIRPTYGWDSQTNTTASVQARQADVYVFCILAHKDKSTINPLHLDQWEFYCISSKTLNQKLGSQKMIGLNSLLSLNPDKAAFNELADTINSVAT